MPAFHYSNPEFGIGISNLAEAMFGNPARDVQLGLLGDQRRTEQVQRRKLEAEALAQEIKNREQEAAIAKRSAVLDAVVGALGLDPSQAAGTRAALEYSLGAGMGSNAQQTANVFPILSAMGLALGDEDDMRRSLVMGGHQPTDQFAGTTARADTMLANEAAAKLKQAKTLADMNNRAATERALVVEVLRESGRDARHAASEAGKDRRAEKRADAKARTPLKVGAADLKAINEGIDQRAIAALGDTHADEIVIDPATRMAVVQAIAELFQNSRNLPTAIEQGWAQVMGMNPQVETSGNWNPFATDRATISPQKPIDAAQAIEEARDAIRRGADPAAVAARLKQMGIDPSGL